MSHSALAGLYRMSRIGLVTPLRDGMNLVAKEYVAAQAPDNPGVLVLSQFAGAAQELKSALIVNPYDIEATAAAIARAFTMPLDERKDRWHAMMAVSARQQRPRLGVAFSGGTLRRDRRRRDRWARGPNAASRDDRFGAARRPWQREKPRQF